MATFTGTDLADTADAGAGTLIGFTGGNMGELIDDAGDVFIALAGNDVIRAGSGDDLLRGGLGADSLDGGLGSDTVDYSDNYGSVFVNLDIGQGFNNAAEGDSYSGIENATGTIFADFMIGDRGANVLDGSQGDDYLIGFLGPDELIGGTGFDIASYEENAGAIFINLLTGLGYGNAAQGDTLSGIEGIVGTSYDDYIIAASTTERGAYIDGGEGNDFIIGKDGSDTLIGGSGEDIVSFQNNLVDYTVGVQDGIIIDLVTGTARDVAFAITDTISGFENVIGSNRADTIVGDSGNNVLAGGLGRDTLTGGEGRDTFLFDTVPFNIGLEERSSNVDTITDFSAFDFIYLDHDVFGALGEGQLAASNFVEGTAAKTPDQYIIYDTATGALFYDGDGSGSAATVQFAVLQGAPSIEADQFFVVV